LAYALSFSDKALAYNFDIDEKLVAKFPYPEGPPNFDYSWGTMRRRDGAVISP
jgi:mannonate dehydratase